MNDRLVVRIVVGGLVAIVLAAMILAALLLLDEHDAADVVIVAGFGTTALGGLVGLLANTRTAEDPTVATAVSQARAAGAAETEAAVLALDPPKTDTKVRKAAGTAKKS